MPHSGQMSEWRVTLWLTTRRSSRRALSCSRTTWVDPAEMAVRMRIRPYEEAGAANAPEKTLEGNQAAGGRRPCKPQIAVNVLSQLRTLSGSGEKLLKGLNNQQSAVYRLIGQPDVEIIDLFYDRHAIQKEAGNDSG